MKKLALAFLILLCIIYGGGVAAASTLTLPSGTKVIETEAFYGDKKLDEVVLPEGITTIGSKAFANSSVKKIYLPSTLISIASDAFSNCSTEGYGPDGTVASLFFKSHNGLTFVIGFPKITYNGHQYQFFLTDEHITWNEAKEKCEAIGGHLVTIGSKAENDFIIDYVNRVYGLSRFIIGLRVEDSGYKWVTGEPYTYSNWGSGQPDHKNVGALLDMPGYSSILPGQWDDIVEGVNFRRAYLCEWGIDQAVQPTSITLDWTWLYMSVGDYEQVGYTLAPNGATSTITWTTSNSSVATVNNGKITAVGAGTATITAKTANGKQATCSVEVEKVPLPAPVLNNPTVNGNIITVSWNSVPGATGYTVLYGTGNTIAEAKRIYLGKEYSTPIYNLAYNTTYNIWVIANNIDGESAPSSMKSVKTVSVVPVSSITIDPNQNPTLCLGQTETITATVLPSNATNNNIRWVKYKGSDYIDIDPITGKITANDCGKIYFYAEATDGSGIRSANAVVTVKPSQIPTLKVEEVGGNYVRLSWNSVPGAHGYKIDCRCDGKSTYYTATEFENQCKMAIKPKKSAQFRILATGIEGSFAASSTTGYSDYIAVPAYSIGKPYYTLKSSTNTTITLDIEASEHNDRFFINYYVSGDVEETEGAVFFEGAPNGTTKTYTLTGLVPGSIYDVWVYATSFDDNDYGTHDYEIEETPKVEGGGYNGHRISTTGSSSYTKPGKPGDLTVTPTNANTANLTWTAATSGDGYYIRLNNIAGDPIKKILGRTNTSCIITNLDAGTDYKVYVSSYFNSNGNESGKAQKSFTTPAANLGKVTGVRQTGYTDTTISLSWNKDNAADGYIVYSRDVTNTVGTWAIKKVTGGNNASAELQGLMSDRSYDVCVVAYSGDIRGTLSDTVQMSTTQKTPVVVVSKPVIRNYNYTDNSIKVDFSAENAKGCWVYYSKSNSISSASPVRATASSVIIPVYPDGSTYYLWVTAYGQDGAETDPAGPVSVKASVDTRLNVAGRVVTSTGEGVEDVWVSLVNTKDSSDFLMAITNSSGEWTITGVDSSNSYRIGYNSDSYTIAQSGTVIQPSAALINAIATLKNIVDNKITFKVKQNNMEISSAVSGSILNFSVVAQGYEQIRLVVDDKPYEEYPLVNGEKTFNRKFTSSGTRKVRIEGYKDEHWGYYSEQKTLSISSLHYNLPTPSVKVPNNICEEAGEEVKISWTDVSADSYSVYVYRDGMQIWPFSGEGSTSNTFIKLPAELFKEAGSYSVDVYATAYGYDSTSGNASFINVPKVVSYKQGRYETYAYNKSGTEYKFEVTYNFTPDNIRILDENNQNVNTDITYIDTFKYGFAVRPTTTGKHTYQVIAEKNNSEIHTKEFSIYTYAEHAQKGQVRFVKSNTVLRNSPEVSYGVSVAKYQRVVLEGNYGTNNKWLVVSIPSDKSENNTYGFIREDELLSQIDTSGETIKVNAKYNSTILYNSEDIEYTINSSDVVESIGVFLSILPASRYTMSADENDFYTETGNCTLLEQNSNGKVFKFTIDHSKMRMGTYKITFIPKPISGTMEPVTVPEFHYFGKTEYIRLSYVKNSNVCLYEEPYLINDYQIPESTVLTPIAIAGDIAYVSYDDQVTHITEYAYAKRNEITDDINPITRRGIILVSYEITSDWPNASSSIISKMSQMMAGTGCELPLEVYSTANIKTIEDALKGIAKRTDDNDITYIYLIFHGGKGEIGINKESKYESYENIARLLKNIRGDVIFINNACHSGSMISKINKSSNSDTYLSTDRYKILAACRAEETAYAITDTALNEFFLAGTDFVDGLYQRYMQIKNGVYDSEYEINDFTIRFLENNLGCTFNYMGNLDYQQAQGLSEEDKQKLISTFRYPVYYGNKDEEIFGFRR